MQKTNKFLSRKILMILFFIFISSVDIAQTIQQFSIYDDVKITIDVPKNYSSLKKTIIILYALPNGNTTEQTMGKKIKEGEDWHFDIQHIKAQTNFIRNELNKQNIVVAYLENNYRSWPSWKEKHLNYISEVQRIVDTVYNLFSAKEKVIYLNGHSGGGESIYFDKLNTWLQNKTAILNVFAYNDSVALLNGKRFVSDTGGTWYRSFLMLRDLSAHFHFTKTRDDSLIVYKSADKRIQFYFKTNPDKKIFHTVQVELNGFIHSVLIGTKRESKNYKYFGERAYKKLIE